MYILELATHMNFIWRQLRCYKLYINYIKNNTHTYTHAHARIKVIITHKTALEIRRLEFKSQFQHKCCVLEQDSFSLGLSFLLCNTGVILVLYMVLVWY